MLNACPALLNLDSDPQHTESFLLNFMSQRVDNFAVASLLHDFFEQHPHESLVHQEVYLDVVDTMLAYQNASRFCSVVMTIRKRMHHVIDVLGPLFLKLFRVGRSNRSVVSSRDIASNLVPETPIVWPTLFDPMHATCQVHTL